MPTPSARRCSALVHAATGTAIIATGKDGRIALFNPGAEAMLGYLAEEVVGELPDRFHPPEELRRQASRLRALPNFSDICRASVAAGERNQLWQLPAQGRRGAHDADDAHRRAGRAAAS